MKAKIALILALAPLAASAADRNSVSVNGQCTREAIPDRGSITVAAEAEDASPSAAAQKVTKIYEKFRTDVKKLDLKDLQLQTSAYSVTPLYNYKQNPPRVSGYRARMGLTVETSELARLGEVIDLASKNDAQRVSQLRNFLSVKRLQETQEACLEEAVKNARLKAEKMAKAAGASLGGVISMSESGGFQPMPIESFSAEMADGARMMKAGPAPTVETQKQEITITVNAVFAVQ